MQLNKLQIVTPSVEGVTNPEVIAAIDNFLQCHSVTETADQLNDLAQACEANNGKLHSHLEISNMVFFVHNFSNLMREVNQYLILVTPIELAGQSMTDILSEALQSWILPDVNNEWSEPQAQVFVYAFITMQKFINDCGEIMKGVATCA